MPFTLTEAIERVRDEAMPRSSQTLNVDR